ncbi:MAG: hypothetical protein GC159_20415 [Phycisphaera sp.]|nr:hypothetical protein [Phycisphaera sp.]
MADPARVHSIDALRDFKVALIKFAEEVREALVDADADMLKAKQWIDGEVKSGWSRNLQKSKEQVTAAKAAVQRKQVYAASKETAPSCVDEQKALAMAKKRVEKSEEKLRNVSRWSRGLEKEVQMCRSQSQTLAQTVDVEIPKAVALLDRLMERLQEYLDEAAVETRASKMAQYWRNTVLDPDEFDPETDTPFKDREDESAKGAAGDDDKGADR